VGNTIKSIFIENQQNLRQKEKIDVSEFQKRNRKTTFSTHTLLLLLLLLFVTVLYLGNTSIAFFQFYIIIANASAIK
jgi:hypothetical protein